jgi:DNA-binding NarL/FixJ family response regulator
MQGRPFRPRGLACAPEQTGATAARAASAARVPERELDGHRMADGTVHTSLLALGELEFAVVSVPLPSSALFPELTTAQWEVCCALLRGGSNAEIAAERQTSIRTVANQVRSLYERLEVASRWELTALFMKRIATTPAAPTRS